MVRGRRVRAVVTSTQNELDYSPILRKVTKRQTRIICLEQSDDKDDYSIKAKLAAPLTPINCKKMTFNNLKMNSPPTPHRIELCSDIVEDLQPKVVDIPVQNGDECKIPLKSRKKLNMNNNNKEKNCVNNNHKLTEYFPVRKSVRKTKTTVLEERQRTIEDALRNNIEKGLEVCIFEGKGRGIVAAQAFNKGDFVVEYSGDFIDINEAKKREDLYAQDQSKGCYMYYFKYHNQQYCIDATAESNRLGRLVNHSKNGNCQTRTIMVDGLPRLVLVAKDDIRIGDEILYDYGDRSKESLKHHPWLAN